QEESQPPKRRVVRIADVSQGFGGRWIYELAASRTGTTLTITEEGEVYNPIFRFMSRFIFGQYRTLEQYARDLGKSFGEDVSPARVRD
ncbi:MAG: hypothetical protein HY561_12770, partial [Gemmatimonadetes bacterium]|nr:hypothetical protein [Gemmatimonadota bacterium]